ncbi:MULTISPECIES: hypothetical protein [Bacillus cereus group]|uniref:hypothetical protein n=1 Tax=Bacillus cereus group TaxID=86661 RepID=UPI00124ECD96|nr:hypothetical protein [Bacillus cereus]KAB2393523.1 hypothetical protein F8171_13645 [Bacillus cereus]KAB2421216.1 hypothetical protein F8167_19975 [Bacillus cereus]
MDKENLGLIEQTILINKRREIYKELIQLAHLIRDKKHEIKLMAGMFRCEGQSVVEDFLFDVITTNELPSDIVLSKETEQYLLTKGIEELLKTPCEIDAEKLAERIHESVIARGVKANGFQ